MQEIEIKAKVRNLEQVEAKLVSLGCKFSEPIEQRDRIFIPKGLILPTAVGVNVLRIRQQGDKKILTLKQRLTNQLNCIEHETEITKADEIAEMIRLLGFYEVSAVNKIRRQSKYNDFEICLDEVEALGNYIEAEKLSAGEDSDKVQAELLVFFESLGVEKTDQVWDGYDVLMCKLRQTT